MHAGPKQVPEDENDIPRRVLFFTFRVEDEERKHDIVPEYMVDDQYLPYHFIEDPTMPVEACIKLLREWTKEEPWRNYPLASHRAACQKLIKTPDHELGKKKANELLSLLRN